MERVGRFEKVSFDVFYKDFNAANGFCADEDTVRDLWNDIRLPERATSGSAGYDFFTPAYYMIHKTPIIIPTGIRCFMKNGWALVCIPKSGLGFRYGTALRNSIGLIDEDFYFSENGGHIMAKMSAQEPCEINKGKAFMQGIFLPFGITQDDNASGVRNGGFGSTGK